MNVEDSLLPHSQGLNEQQCQQKVSLSYNFTGISCNNHFSNRSKAISPTLHNHLPVTDNKDHFLGARTGFPQYLVDFGRLGLVKGRIPVRRLTSAELV